MGGLLDVIESSGLLKAVTTVAPLLGSVLGSPLAGVAINLLSNVFGTNPTDVQGLASKIIDNPSADLRIKSLENEHSEMLAKIASSDYVTEVDDRKDARKYSAQYKDFLRHMAYLVTAGFFGVLLLMFLPIPFNVSERELLSMLIGMLVSKWQTIVDFFYGSNSIRKNGEK